MDFNDKDASGNYKLKEFHSAYGYDVKEALKQLPVKELTTTETTEKLVNALINGHRPAVNTSERRSGSKAFYRSQPSI